MNSRLFADMLVGVHFLWILFMLIGFFMTLWAVLSHTIFHRPSCFFDRWIFRILHLGGILFVGTLAILGKYCPLTLWESHLRSQYKSDSAYSGSFIVSYLERLVYPSVHPLAIIIPTILAAVFTVAVFVICPPKKIKHFWHMLLSSMSRCR